MISHWSWSNKSSKAASLYPEVPEEPTPDKDSIFPDIQTPDAASDSTDSDDVANTQLANHSWDNCREDQDSLKHVVSRYRGYNI